MKKTLLLLGFLILALQFSSAAIYSSGTSISITEVTVNLNGSWQWGNDLYHTYTMNMIRERNVVSLTEEFKFDLDDADERSISLSYIGHVYTISAERSPAGGTDVIFKAYKDGKPCNQNDGRVIKTLYNTSNIDVQEYKQACGIGFLANWETLATETDMSIEEIYFMGQEVNSNVQQMMNYLAQTNLTQTVATLESSKSKFRIADLKNVNDVIPDQKGAYKIYSKPVGLSKNSGKENGLVISNNGQILYVVFIKGQFSNDYYVAKPKTSKKVTDYKSWDELKQDSILNWESLQREKLSSMEDVKKWLEKGAIGAGVAAAPTAAAYTIGTTGVWAFGAGSNMAVFSSSALAASTGTAIMSTGATTAAVAGTVPGVAGGGMLGSGALTAISITPVGWVLLGAAAVAGGGYAVYNFTTSENYGYDNGGLILNIDPELLSPYAAKINFALIKDPDFKPEANNTSGWIGIDFSESLNNGVTIDTFKNSLKFYSDNETAQEIPITIKKASSTAIYVPANDLGLTAGVSKTFYFTITKDNQIGKGPIIVEKFDPTKDLDALPAGAT